jgi:Cu-Zn family superoxide dismutase
MRQMKIGTALALMVAASGMTGGATAGAAEVGKAELRATAEDSSGAGSATVTPSGDGLAIVVDVHDAPPGTHGLHIHEFGGCRDAGKAAGGHYNPDGVPHGHLPKDGLGAAHAGDLGNIEIDDNGTGRLEVTVPGLSLTGGKYNVAGRAIIVHEKADDFGQPTGNAGGRIACGPIVIAQ